MSETSYYDGTHLLSMKDLSGETPEIFACTTNRTAGKTTYFSKLITNKFLKGFGKFMLLYRYSYELDNVADTFFKDIKGLFFQDKVMTSKQMCNGVYQELFLDGEPCGYATDLNHAEQIKKKSHLFSDTQRMFFDEFQSETNHYCPNEITKFMSIHDSVARGQGKQARYVPVYMCGNTVSLLNPYYVAWNFSSKVQKDTKFLRGNGIVLEQGYVDSARRAQEASGFHRAFSDEKYTAYSEQGIYLNDNQAFIEKPTGRTKYLASIRYNNKDYGIREYEDLGIIYCDSRPDITYPFKIAVTTDEHNINYVILRRNDMFISQMRYFFERGCFRFKDLQCKEAIMKMLSY